jgi:hypothetical protein
MKNPLMGSPSCRRHRSVKSSTSSGRDSSSDSEWTNQKEKQRRAAISSHHYYSFGRAMALAALCSSVAAVVTAIIAVYFFYSSTLLDLYSDQLITTTSVVRTRFRPMSTSMETNSQLRSPQLPPKITSLERWAPPQNETKRMNAREEYDDGIQPHVAVSTWFQSQRVSPSWNTEFSPLSLCCQWLMSFPNRQVNKLFLLFVAQKGCSPSSFLYGNQWHFIHASHDSRSHQLYDSYQLCLGRRDSGQA